MESRGLFQHLSADQYLAGSVPVYVNHPTHDGDTPLHDHDFLEIAVIAEGRGVHRSIHGEDAVGAGDVLVLQPGQWHAYERCRALRLSNCCIGLGLLASELAWTLRDPQIAQLLPRHRPGVPLLRVGAGQEIRRLRLPEDQRAAVFADLNAIRKLQTGGSAPLHRADVIAHTLLVLGRLARVAVVASPMAPALDDMPASMRALTEQMEERLEHAWGLVEMARRAQVSRFHLVRIFRRHLGSTPVGWLTRRRMERAAVMLMTTDLSIAEVGRRVGWADANFFARRFRAFFRQTPSAYRRALAVAPIQRPDEDWIQW